MVSLRAAFLVSQHPAINHAFLLREIRELRRLGFDIHTVSIAGPDRPPEALIPEELEEMSRTFYVKPLGWKGALRRHVGELFFNPVAYLDGMLYALRLSRWNLAVMAPLLAYFAEAVVIGRWMRENRLRHLHVQYSSTVGLLVRRMFPIELSISFHGPDEFRNPGGFWMREKVAAAHFVRAISQFARSQIMKDSDVRDWNKIDVAYMGVAPDQFRPRPFRPAPLPLEILCVGRLAPVKAQDVLLGAVRELKDAGKNVRLNLAGGGPDRAALEAHATALGIRDEVVFHGWMRQEDLDALYARADVFALASFAEGVPGVLMEAMAMEIPCVSTWITGVPELIRDGVDGLLAPPSDPKALAIQIRRLIDDPAFREELGKAGRRRVIEQFHLRRNAERLFRIFERRLTSAPQEAHSAADSPELQRSIS